MKKKRRLKKSQARLTIDEHGFSSLEIPNQGDEEFVPDYVYFLTVIGILIKTEDSNFQKYIARKGNQLFKDCLNQGIVN
jgi:hypothetical protein